MKWGVVLYNLVLPLNKPKNITAAQNKCITSQNLQHTFSNTKTHNKIMDILCPVKSIHNKHS